MVHPLSGVMAVAHALFSCCDVFLVFRKEAFVSHARSALYAQGRLLRRHHAIGRLRADSLNLLAASPSRLGDKIGVKPYILIGFG